MHLCTLIDESKGCCFVFKPHLITLAWVALLNPRMSTYLTYNSVDLDMVVLPTIIFLASLVILFLYFGHGADNHGSLPASNIPSQRAIWYIGSAGFFIDPSQFLKDSMKWAKDSIFSFRILDVGAPTPLRGNSL